MSFSCSRIQSWILHWLKLSCLLGLLQSRAVSLLSLFFVTLTLLKTINQIFCRTSLNLGLSDDSSGDQVQIMHFGQGHRSDVRAPFRCTISEGPRYWSLSLLVTLTLKTWLRWYMPGFSTVKLLFCPLQLISILWRGTLQITWFFSSHFCSLIIKIHWWFLSMTIISMILAKGWFSISSIPTTLFLLSHLFIWLFIYISKGSWIFMDYNPLLSFFIILLMLSQNWPLRAPTDWLLRLFDMSFF